ARCTARSSKVKAAIIAVCLVLLSAWSVSAQTATPTATPSPASPVLDGTPTKGAITNASSFTTNYPGGISAGDCCIIQYCGSYSLSTASGCAASGSGWNVYNMGAWNSTYQAQLLTHVYSGSGDTAPTCNFTTGRYGAWDMTCYKNSNACIFGAGPTAQVGSASKVVSGPGLTNALAGDAHLFFTCAYTQPTFSNYNDNLVQEVTHTETYASVAEADSIFASSGAQPTARATISSSLANIGIEADLRSSAVNMATATPTATATP